MSPSLKQGLIIRNTTNDPEVMERVKETVRITLDSIKSMDEAELDKLSPDEMQAMVDNKVLNAVKALNIEGLSIVPANDAGLDMMEGVSDRDRTMIRDALENFKESDILPSLQERTEAVHGVVMSMAKYAMDMVKSGQTSGPPELFHDFGQIVANAVTEMAGGAKAMDGGTNALLPDSIKILNRIAFISMMKMLLHCTKEQAENSSIDQAGIREDLTAVLGGKGEDQLKTLVETLDDYASAASAKAGTNGMKLH